jgi:outer membrane protein TolC
VTQSEEAVALRTLDLRFLFGQPPEPTFERFAPAPMPEPTPEALDLGVQMQRAVEANPQLRSLQLGLKLTEIDVQLATSLLNPRLDFIGQVGTTGRALEFPETIRGASRFDNVVWSAGLQFQAPIQNRAARGQAEVARLAGMDAQLQAQSLAIDLRRSVAQLATQMQSAATRIQLARETVKWAQLNLEAERAKFSVGRSTNNEVILRQQELKDAQLQVARAQVEFFKFETALSAASGDVLERNHVTLQGL